MLKGLTPIPSYPPVSETRVLQSEMFSRPFGRQLDLRLVEAYTQDYDKAKPGDIYVYADYVDYTSKQLLGEKDGTTAISAMILRVIMRKGRKQSFQHRCKCVLHKSNNTYHFYKSVRRCKGYRYQERGKS